MCDTNKNVTKMGMIVKGSIVICYYYLQVLKNTIPNKHWFPPTSYKQCISLYLCADHEHAFPYLRSTYYPNYLPLGLIHDR
jgi:hypothetical protein